MPSPSTIPSIGPLADRPVPARILADYHRFWDVVIAISRRPSTTWRPTLATVTTEPLLSQTIDLLREQHRKGLVDYGKILLEPRLAGSTARTVSIIDCQDASRSGTLHTDTGVPASVGSARRPFAGVMALGKDGRWRLFEARFLPGTC